jgi:hypothetical protein
MTMRTILGSQPDGCPARFQKVGEATASLSERFIGRESLGLIYRQIYEEQGENENDYKVYAKYRRAYCTSEFPERYAVIVYDVPKANQNNEVERL